MRTCWNFAKCSTHLQLKWSICVLLVAQIPSEPKFLWIWWLLFWYTVLYTASSLINRIQSTHPCCIILNPVTRRADAPLCKHCYILILICNTLIPYLSWPTCWPFGFWQRVTASAWHVTRQEFVRPAATRPRCCCSENASMTAAPISTTSTPQHAPAEVHPPRQPSTHCEGKHWINNEDTWAALYDNHKLLSTHIACSAVCYNEFKGTFNHLINCGYWYVNPEHCECVLTQFYIFRCTEKLINDL